MQTLQRELGNMLTSELSRDTISVCDKCGEKTSMQIELLGQIRTVKVACRCRTEELNARDRMRENENKQRKLMVYRSSSMMDDNFESWTFDNWLYFEPEDQKMLNMGKKYVEKWDEVKAKNQGILLLGEKGVGKSYLTGCIVNALYKEGIPALQISSVRMLERIKASFNKDGEEGSEEMIKTFKHADLLVIDDLGVENRTEWTIKTLYMILDDRYRSQKPTIISSNLDMKQLSDHLTGSDGIARTFDRIIEMCVPVTYKGTSKRKKSSKGKKDDFIQNIFG